MNADKNNPLRMRARETSSRNFDGHRNHERCRLQANRTAARLFATLTLIAGAAHGATMTLDWSGSPPAIGGGGTWNTTGSNWTPDGSTFEPWSNASGNTAQFYGTSGTVTLGSAITAGGLIFEGSAYTLTGANTLSVAANGQIALDSGTSTNIDTALVAGNGVQLSGTGTLNINGASGGSLTLSGNGLSSLNSPVLNLASDPTGGVALTINGASGSGSFGGTITGAGSVAVSGGTSVTLSSANTFTGSTTITGGSLVLGTGLALQNSTVNINVDNGLNLNGLTSAAIGGLAGTGALNLGATALTVGGAATTAYSAALSGTTGGLTYAGTGALSLNGGGSLYNLVLSSGALNITGGTLTLTDANTSINVTGGALTISGGATVNNPNSDFALANGTGATFTVSGAGTTLKAGREWYADSGGSLAASNAAVVNSFYTIVGAGGSGTLNVSGGAAVSDNTGTVGASLGSIGTATVTGTSSAWSNTTLGIGGNGGAGGTGTLNLNSGGQAFIYGATRLWTSGSSININGGQMTTGSLAGTTGTTINLTADPASGGAALRITGGFGSAEFDGTITGAGTLAQTGGNQILTGANTYAHTQVSGGTLTQSGGSNSSQITASNGGVFYALNTTLSPLNGFGIIATQSGGQVYYDGAVVNGGSLEGTGHSIINGPGAALNVTTFTGTTITSGAVVTQNAAATMNVVTTNGTIDNNATLTWNNGTIGSSGVLNVNSTVNATGLLTNGVINIFDGDTLANSGTHLTLGAGSRTYVGSLAEPGGTLSETGGTIELNGGLLVNNGTVDGTVDVNYGGLAEGAGTYGAVNIGTGGVFHPGNSPGTVTSSSATLGAGGGFDFDIDNATGAEGTDWSLWDITGDLDIVAGMTPNSEFTIFLDSLTSGDAPGPLENFNPADSYSWTILDAANINGFSANKFALNTAGFDEALDGGTLSLVSNGQDLALDFTAAAAAPEPSTMFLLGIGFLALGLAKRKRKLVSPR